WHVDLAVAVVTPSRQSAPAAQNQAVIPSSRQRHYVSQTGWYIRLAVIVISPGDNRSVISQRQAVSGAARNRYHIAQACRHYGLAIINSIAWIQDRSGAPGHDCAVTAERQAVTKAG